MSKCKLSRSITVIILSMSMVAVSFFAAFAISDGTESQKLSDEKATEAEKAAEKASSFAEQAAAAEKEIGAVKTKIEAAEAEIAKTQEELNAKKAEVKDQTDALNDRLTAMYKTGTVGFVDVILNSNNVTELITNLGMVHRILSSDQEILEGLKEDYEEINALKKKQVAEGRELESSKAELEATQDKYKDLAAEYEKKMQELEAESARLATKAKAEAAAYEAELERQRQAAAAAAAESAQEQNNGENPEDPANPENSAGTPPASVPSNGYTWPCSGTITQYFGNSWSIYSSGRHGGIDIGTPVGTPIYAPKDGVISVASYGWNGGYGNLTTLYIGNGYLFFFGHQSSIVVSEKQYVKQGQLIGYTGNTGLSTGPHLHFELQVNGVRTDPMILY